MFLERPNLVPSVAGAPPSSFPIGAGITRFGGTPKLARESRQAGIPAGIPCRANTEFGANRAYPILISVPFPNGDGGIVPKGKTGSYPRAGRSQ